MKSLIIPEDSYGDDFAKQTYSLLVSRLEIDPIVEGRLMENKIFSILNPDDLRDLDTEEKREIAHKKANRVVNIYIKRSKKFWRLYQLYCFNRGQLRATTTLSRWIKNSNVEIERLRDDQENILKGVL